MYITTRNSDIIKQYRDKFLCLDHNGTPLDLSLFKNKCVVYVVENLTNHKIYIGKTIDLLNRANNYIYHYRTPKNKHSERLINTIIREEGIENFRMYPIYISKDRIELAKDERRFIQMYQTINPDLGYNDNIPSGLDHSIKGKKPHNHSIETKIKKAKPVICINPDIKQLYACVGMKLFGDFVGSGKDNVKNCNRRGIRHCGYYVIYTSKVDRDDVANICIEKQRKYKIWQEKTHPNYHQDNYDVYLTYVRLVDKMMSERSAQCFIDAGFKCEYITYNNGDEDQKYEIREISEFLSSILYEN